MTNKPKISPRVIWLAKDLSHILPIVQRSRKKNGVGSINTSGGSYGGSSGGNSGGNSGTQKICTATPFSNGYDEITTYVFDNIIIDGVFRHSAYVACDYVK